MITVGKALETYILAQQLEPDLRCFGKLLAQPTRVLDANFDVKTLSNHAIRTSLLWVLYKKLLLIILASIFEAWNEPDG